MARIANKHTIWWGTVDEEIQWDYTQSLKGLNVDFATMLIDDGTGNMVPCITHFHHEKLKDIDDKVIELGLKDSNNVVTPHVYGEEQE